MIPNVALLDPELTVSLPAKQTAECGMDALTQLIESYVSKKSQPIPDALAAQGEYLVRMRAHLDIETLPAPLRPVAYTSPSWHLNSGWTTWTITQ